MALRRKIVDLVGLHLLDDANQVRGVREVAVMQLQSCVFFVRIPVQVIDTVGIER